MAANPDEDWEQAAARWAFRVCKRALPHLRPPASAVAALFKTGDRVMHRKFGEGNVLEIRGSGSDARIVIGFAAYGQKEFVLSIAPIVKVND